MSKELSEMTLEELWQLFPIILSEHKEQWSQWYEEEADYLSKILTGILVARISHIGSTAIREIMAKPIVDILIELKGKEQWNIVRNIMIYNGYLCMSEDDTRMVFNKGYTKNGFAERVFHIHISVNGDHDELYFRDYLKDNPDIAREYEVLKLSLWKRFEHDRDGYTEAKSAFVERWTTIAKSTYKNRYELDENVEKRPALDVNLASDTFRQYYYLKEELVQFCRENDLPTSGGKMEIAERIAYYLDTGKVKLTKPKKKKKSMVSSLTEESRIEPNFVCSEVHRAFFKKHIGTSFSFNVAFQKWLKSNTGKTYQDAIAAYHQILAEKKRGTTTIDKQFEYNTYIRAFFEDNKGKSLNQAIACWKYKKQQKGHNRYEHADLEVLENMMVKPYVKDIKKYLVCDEVINYDHEQVRTLADQLYEAAPNDLDYIKTAFEYVRDQFPHSADIDADELPCSASEVLACGHGICFTKAHLLTALLRCKSIPTGLCYQKLILDDDEASVLVYHGLIGVYLQEQDKWIRLDARGNKEGVDAQFSIQQEQLAFPVRPDKGEMDILTVYPDPDKYIVEILKNNVSRRELWDDLPTKLHYLEE